MAVLIGVDGPRAGRDEPDGQEGQVNRWQRPIRLVQSDTIRSDALKFGHSANRKLNHKRRSFKLR